MRRFFDRDWYRYLWHYRVSRGDKIGFAAIGCLAVMLSGLGTAAYVSQEEAAAVTVRRLVTIVHTLPGGTSTEVVTETEKLVKPGEPRIITVTRNGKTVTLRVTGPEVTDTETIKGPTVVKHHTDTDTETETETEHSTETQTTTVDHPTTTTETSSYTTTETANRDVPGPERTTTETETQTETETHTTTETHTNTVTETVTNTNTQTETETVTETVTETATGTEPP